MAVETILKDENLSLTTTYADILNLNTQGMKDLVLVLKNMDNAISLSYKIFGTAKESTSPLPLSDDSWVNLLDTNTDPMDYNHTTEKTIPADLCFYESMTVKWFCIKVQAKCSSGTTSAKLWLRGLY